MERHLRMSQKELERKRVMEQVLEGRLALKTAAQSLGISRRQAVRIRQRFQAEGAKGLVHRSRGRPSNRRYSEPFKRKVLKRFEERYRAFDIGPTLLAEKLAQDGLAVDHETLRRWLLKEGYWTKRRKRAQHRARRERKPHFGELVQMDGSHHRWFGAERARTCLMQMVDDATGTTLSLMAEQETTEAAMRLLWAWCERFGVPQALYTDKKSVFVTDRAPTLEEQLADQMPLTVFGKACKKLGIAIISANSPQAKGRVERKHAVMQDRFVTELALRGIKTIAGANALLQNGFTDRLNQKFAQAPLDPQDYHQPLCAHTDLADVFCFEEERTLSNDWTVRFQNRYYQIARDNAPLPKPKDKILFRRRLDGQLFLLYKGRPLRHQILTPAQYQRTQLASTPERQAPAPPQGKGSPWRQNCTLMFAETQRE